MLPIDTGNRQRVRLGVRPEHIEVTRKTDADGDLAYTAQVLLDELLGADALLSLGIGDVRVLARVGGADHPVQGDAVTVRFNPSQLHAFDLDTGAALPKHQ